MSVNSKSSSRLVLNCLIVFVVFMVIDYLYYGLIAPAGPYSQDLVNKLIWTAVLALAFGYVFSQLYPKDILQGAWFGFVTGVAFIAVIVLSGYVVTVVFVYGLEAFRGIPSSGGDTALIIIKSAVSGGALAYTGKETAGGDR